MTFEQMYNKIDAIEHQLALITKMLEMQQPREPEQTEIITGPEMRRLMGLSQTQFRGVQAQMPFLFRYKEGGTLRAYRRDFESWLKSQYRPCI